MSTFGQTLRKLRISRGRGLRETARLVNISPSYLSRIERGMERPPRPEVIKAITGALAIRPDVLFELSSSTDPEITNLLHERPKVLELVRAIKDSDISDEQLSTILSWVNEEL